jgi:hypothetical protein
MANLSVSAVLEIFSVKKRKLEEETRKSLKWLKGAKLKRP